MNDLPVEEQHVAGVHVAGSLFTPGGSSTVTSVKLCVVSAFAGQSVGQI